MGGTGPAILDGWHAALELGARTVWMGGTRLRSWGPHGIWMGGGPAGTQLRSWGGPQSLDGWHAALEQGARGFDACAGHFDGLSASWVTA